ncbi:MAG: hypothetical protein M1833_004383 [Piccolia ochrophora]|nr:MAG: hypothetical protein M1833_004383 [Piccolia ochrophora]
MWSFGSFLLLLLLSVRASAQIPSDDELAPTAESEPPRTPYRGSRRMESILARQEFNIIARPLRDTDGHEGAWGVRLDPTTLTSAGPSNLVLTRRREPNRDPTRPWGIWRVPFRYVVDRDERRLGYLGLKALQIPSDIDDLSTISFSLPYNGRQLPFPLLSIGGGRNIHYDDPVVYPLTVYGASPFYVTGLAEGSPILISSLGLNTPPELIRLQLFIWIGKQADPANV